MLAAATVLIPVSGVLFSVFGSHALSMRREKRYGGFWGAFALAWLPGLGSAFWLASEPDVSANVRNAIVGAIGAIIGCATAIWFAYVVSDWRRADEPLSRDRTPASEAAAPSGAEIVAPGNTGIVTSGQSGGTNTVGR